MPTWILITQWLSWLVLAILVLLSVWSIAIMIERRRFVRSKTPEATDLATAKNLLRLGQIDELKRRFPEANPKGPVPEGVIWTLLHTKNQSRGPLELAVKSYLTEERTQLESGLTVLATLGSNAPFIGLFGTVLGIIQAFGQLAGNRAGTSTVMSGISEALIATAVGLFVAIPAVIAFNVFSRQTRLLIAEGEIIRDLYLSQQVPSGS